jgi:hypothetical protein
MNFAAYKLHQMQLKYTGNSNTSVFKAKWIKATTQTLQLNNVAEHEITVQSKYVPRGRLAVLHSIKHSPN